MTGWSTARAVLVAGALVGTLAACTTERQVAAPDLLRDPCALISDDLLRRLAPGAQPTASADLGDRSGSRECAVDLTSGTGMRGDLLVAVAVDGTGLYDEKWRAQRCSRIAARPTSEGPGDASCVTVTPWDGGETRFDGWAWRGTDYEVRVAYQVVEPQTLPAGAEADLRAVLASAVESLPSR